MALAAALSRFCGLGMVACLASGLAWQQSGAIIPMPRPGEGTVASGTYTNKYFDLSYPLPAGWTEGLAGPPPSHNGYYVLSTFAPQGEQTGMILIAAQDIFFAAKPLRDAKTMAGEVARAMSQLDGTTVDQQTSEVTIAGRPFSRVDFSGVGLFHRTWITEIRCHLVSVTLTTRSRDEREALVQSLDRLASIGKRAAPVCIRDYAADEQVVHKVEPAELSSSPMSIPVRIIINSDGTVKHVHVIRAAEAQRKTIEEALRQWTFKPHTIAGQPVQMETGLAFGGSRKVSGADGESGAELRDTSPAQRRARRGGGQSPQ